jgi:hypothetical protein
LPQQIIYGSTPRPLPIEKRGGKKNVLLLFPGAGGPDANSDRLEAKIKASDIRAGYSRWSYTYNWLDWRGPFVRASFDGQLVGRSVCGQLAKAAREKPIDDLHVIGISVGAFAADSCTKEFRKELNELSSSTSSPITDTNANINLPQKKAGTHISLTLLDPFTSKGIFGYGWGQKNFGLAADSVVTYLNTDDPVPSTDQPLNKGTTIDITNNEQRNKYMPADNNMHSWPVAFLAENWVTEPSTGMTRQKMDEK